jgi:hypothetical protein
VPRKLVQLLAVVFAVWIAVGLVALVLFHWGGAHPTDRGKGEPIGLSRTS